MLTLRERIRITRVPNTVKETRHGLPAVQERERSRQAQNLQDVAAFQRAIDDLRSRALRTVAAAKLPFRPATPSDDHLPDSCRASALALLPAPPSGRVPLLHAFSQMPAPCSGRSACISRL